MLSIHYAKAQGSSYSNSPCTKTQDTIKKTSIHRTMY